MRFLPYQLAKLGITAMTSLLSATKSGFPPSIGQLSFEDRFLGGEVFFFGPEGAMKGSVESTGGLTFFLRVFVASAESLSSPSDSK